MWRSFRRAVREGAEFGVCAGIVLILAEIVAAMVQRQPVFYPLRKVAGALAPTVLRGMPASTVIPAGIAIHLLLAAVFGVGYCLLNASFSDRTRTHWDRQTAIGLLFGAAVWVVKLQLVAGYAYPALLHDLRVQFAQLILHTFFYGFPLALFYANAERRLLPLLRAMQRSDAPRPSLSRTGGEYVRPRDAGARGPRPLLR